MYKMDFSYFGIMLGFGKSNHIANIIVTGFGKRGFILASGF